jgi:hypothetical protein
VKYVCKTLSFAFSFLLALPAMPGSPQDCNSGDKYADVLDRLFPVEWEQCHFGQRFSLCGQKVSIRILPGLGQESQIVFCRQEGADNTFVVHSVPAGDKTIWGHIMKRKKREEGVYEAVETKEPARKIAAAIQMTHKSCKMDPQVVDDWFKELAAIRMDLPELSGGTDGVTYEVTLQHGADRMQASIWAGDSHKPVIVLVQKINAEIEKANCVEIAPHSKAAGPGPVQSKKHSAES